MDLNLSGSRIVVADDSFDFVKKLEIFLESQGYQVFSALDGCETLEIISKVNPDLIILDMFLSVVDGIDICKIVKNNEKTSLIPVIIMASGYSKDDKINAMRAGANDFLSKYCDGLELKLKVESLVKLKRAVDQLENANNIIQSLAKAVEVKDKYTEGHAERVSNYATRVAQRLNLKESQIREIKMAGLLHDIGKIGVPDTILKKRGKLTNEEYAIIKKHPVIGEEICNPIKSFEKIKKIIRHHHEKLNGKGYPDGLYGGQINIETRIMTVVDIYDALTSDRAYRKSLNYHTALKKLEEGVKKGELDGHVVDVFVQMLDSEHK